MIKQYRLKKDLPTFNAGSEFFLDVLGNLRSTTETVYAASTLKKFPNILKDWFEEISEEPKTVWDLADGDTYYFVTGNGLVQRCVYDGYLFDRALRDRGLIFLTEEDARKYDEWRKAKVILERDTKGVKVEDPTDPSYCVCYDPETKELSVLLQFPTTISHEIIFATEEDAKASINAHEKEWKIYLGVGE